MRAIVLATAIVLSVAGCGGFDPVIADLEEDKVVVQAWANQPSPEIQETATQGCAIHNRSAVGPLHVASVPNTYQYSFLYACK